MKPLQSSLSVSNLMMPLGFHSMKILKILSGFYFKRIWRLAKWDFSGEREAESGIRSFYQWPSHAHSPFLHSRSQQNTLQWMIVFWKYREIFQFYIFCYVLLLSLVQPNKFWYLKIIEHLPSFVQKISFIVQLELTF